MNMYDKYLPSARVVEEKRVKQPLQTQSRKAEYKKRLGYKTAFPAVDDPREYVSNVPNRPFEGLRSLLAAR